MISTYDNFMSIFEKGQLGEMRAHLMKSAYGHVLEIGSGTGVNLAYYDYEQITDIVLSDKATNPVLVRRSASLNVAYQIQAFDVNSIPYEDNHFDTIVVTLVFCSVVDVQKGLSEIKRVLKDNGQVIFIEHVLPEGKSLKTVFDILTPIWKHIASGCHLNREFIKSLESEGFKVTEMARFNKTAFVSGIACKDKLDEYKKPR